MWPFSLASGVEYISIKKNTKTLQSSSLFFLFFIRVTAEGRLFRGGVDSRTYTFIGDSALSCFSHQLNSCNFLLNLLSALSLGLLPPPNLSTPHPPLPTNGLWLARTCRQAYGESVCLISRSSPKKSLPLSRSVEFSTLTNLHFALIYFKPLGKDLGAVVRDGGTAGQLCINSCPVQSVRKWEAGKLQNSAQGLPDAANRNCHSVTN